MDKRVDLPFKQHVMILLEKSIDMRDTLCPSCPLDPQE